MMQLRSGFAWRQVRKSSTLSVNNSSDLALREIVGTFDAPIRFCAAYGSGVFPQQNLQHSKDKPLVDFIFGVTHTQHWHSLNIRQNPHHYSCIRLLGSKAIQMVQDDFAAKIYYNTNCVVGGRAIKYGVISMAELLSDLEDWETLFCAGRLHKPVKIVQNDARAQIAQMKNLESALATAMFLLPERFNESDLYRSISNISYLGDFRMRLVRGEDPRKVDKIVHNQMEEFKELYHPIISNTRALNLNSVTGDLEQDMSQKSRVIMVKSLPKLFQGKLIRRQIISKGSYANLDDTNIIVEDLVSADDFKRKVEKSIIETSLRTSISQALKGVFTAGLGTSIQYAKRKLAKGCSNKN